MRRYLEGRKRSSSVVPFPVEEQANLVASCLSCTSSRQLSYQIPKLAVDIYASASHSARVNDNISTYFLTERLGDVPRDTTSRVLVVLIAHT